MATNAGFLGDESRQIVSKATNFDFGRAIRACSSRAANCWQEINYAGLTSTRALSHGA
jgi:hypothetical protein